MTADVHRLADETQSSVAAVCRVLELPRSTVYARRNRAPSERALKTAQLDVEVAAIHEESGKRYGSPRVHLALRRRGRRVSRKRIEARMRALGLRSKRSKRFRRTTRADDTHAPSPNLLDRKFTRDVPDEAWCGDITFVWTQEGWVYLALLIDLCSRTIVGWAVSQHCNAELALECLNRAVARHGPWFDVQRDHVPLATTRTRDGPEHESSRKLLGQRSRGIDDRQHKNRAFRSRAR
jgi:putative transposase